MWNLAPALLCVVLTGPGGQEPAPAPAPTGTAAAPEPAPARGEKPPTPAHTGVRAIFRALKDDITHLPSIQNLWTAGLGGGLALALSPFDERVSESMANEGAAINNAFAPAKYYGGTAEQVALSLGTWGLGRLTHKPKLSHLGMDLLRAQALSEILVEPIKLVTHRQRPDGSDHRSFPSGHASVTFADATVLQRHLGWKRSLWAYAIASYVAASRVHDGRHYVSDVVFGAALGTIAGRTVTQHGRNTWVLNPAVVPGGVVVNLTHAPF